MRKSALYHGNSRGNCLEIYTQRTMDSYVFLKGCRLLVLTTVSMMMTVSMNE